MRVSSSSFMVVECQSVTLSLRSSLAPRPLDNPTFRLLRCQVCSYRVVHTTVVLYMNLRMGSDFNNQNVGFRLSVYKMRYVTDKPSGSQFLFM